MDKTLLETSDYYYEMDKACSGINKMHYHKKWRYNLAMMEARKVAITVL